MKDKKIIARTIAIVLVDWVLIAMAGGLGLLIRYDFSLVGIPVDFKETLMTLLPWQLLITTVVFSVRKMYHFVWRSVNIHDVSEMILSVFLAFALTMVAEFIFDWRLPISVNFVSLMFQLIALVGIRCALRFKEVIHQAINRNSSKERIMLIGAGEAGRMLMKEMATSDKAGGKVCCIIDDNEAKWGRYLDGVRILGGRNVIAEAAKRERVGQIIFAIPSASARDKKEILDICQSTGCRVRVLPGIYQLVNGSVTLSDVKDVQVEDLLGRESIKLNEETIDGFLSGKTVMVTGGGGSIGSELCRQIVKHSPRRLIILDIYENNVYDIQQELSFCATQDIEVCVEIASVRDRRRMEQVMHRHCPHVVFHAAAHKHVPLMENCTAEAVKNNVFGTYNTVLAAEKSGVQKFVLISTDKAVNPTNFMGATKRFCEMIIQSRPKGRTEFCAVRFGNVLGSNGSVVPLFKRQIEAGGPITITDKRIIRYFMTIPEAAQLVLEAGAIARQGQIFVLDMGEPVKILDLAEKLIQLSGLEPYRDIEIREIGLRPGEKLYEELLTSGADLTQTANHKIFVEQTENISEQWVNSALEQLDDALRMELRNEDMIALMRSLVDTYRSPEEYNSIADFAEESCMAAAAAD